MFNTSTTVQKMLIGGKWESRDRTIDVRDPQDNSLINTIPAASAEDMLYAIEEAKEGVGQASRMPVHERAALLDKTADIVADRKEIFATIIAREGSKTIKEARNEVSRTVHTLRLSGQEAARMNGETIAFDQIPGNEDRIGYYYHFPIGLVGAITPFNDPLNLVAHKIGPALAGGDAVVLKPATFTPLSALYLAEALLDAGLPPKILSVITGAGSEIGDPLVTHPDVQMLTFTGGLETGKDIVRKAGLKKIGMELGSNSPVIVLNDADIDKAVDSTVSGAFSAAGQNCIGVQRVFIQKEVYKDFSERFIQRTKQFKVGNKLSELTDMGPMIHEDEALRIEKWVDEAVENGAHVACGGTRNGAYFMPTVLMDVPFHCKVVQEEAFGPVVSLFSCNDLEDAIEMANRVNYGLQAGIFTGDLDKAFQAVGQLEAGGVIINDSSDFRIDSMPFGGVKGSGIGREGVKFAIQNMTEKKVVCFKLAR